MYSYDEDVLNRFDIVIEYLLVAITSDSGEFRSPVAPLTGNYSVHLQRECEIYGMSKELYSGILKGSKKHPQRFKLMMAAGNFSFEGTNYNTNKLLVLCFGLGDTVKSHIPSSYLPPLIPAVVGLKRKQTALRGRGRQNYKSARATIASSVELTITLSDMIDNAFINHSVSKRSEILIEATKYLLNKYEIDYKELAEKKNVNINERIVSSIKSYLNGLQVHGGRFSKTEDAIKNILTASSVYAVTDIYLGNILGVQRKRIATSERQRGVFDNIVLREEGDHSESASSYSPNVLSNDSSDGDSINYSEFNGQSDEEIFSEKSSDEENEVNKNFNKDEVKKVKRKNAFETALALKCRKEKEDKLDLDVVRLFCHEECRMDTFSTCRILVLNYDDTHTYHDICILSESLKGYFKSFESSQEYANWQNENRRVNNRHVAVTSLE